MDIASARSAIVIPSALLFHDGQDAGQDVYLRGGSSPPIISPSSTVPADSIESDKANSANETVWHQINRPSEVQLIQSAICPPVDT